MFVLLTLMRLSLESTWIYCYVFQLLKAIFVIYFMMQMWEKKTLFLFRKMADCVHNFLPSTHISSTYCSVAQSLCHRVCGLTWKCTLEKSRTMLFTLPCPALTYWSLQLFIRGFLLNNNALLNDLLVTFHRIHSQVSTFFFSTYFAPEHICQKLCW